MLTNNPPNILPRNPNLTAETPSEILIVFKSNHKISHHKTHFNHCFMLAHYQNQWILTDPLFNSIFQCKISNITKKQLITTLKKHNCKIIALPTPNINIITQSILPQWLHMLMLTITLFSCVAIVKRTLNIKKYSIITPNQLYRFLLKKNKKNY